MPGVSSSLVPLRHSRLENSLETPSDTTTNEIASKGWARLKRRKLPKIVLLDVVGVGAKVATVDDPNVFAAWNSISDGQREDIADSLRFGKFNAIGREYAFCQNP